VYQVQDQNKKLFKNIELKRNQRECLCTVYGDFEGEPNVPLEYTKYKDANIQFQDGDKDGL